MKFTTNRKDLLEALTITGSVIAVNNILPILSNYLFSIADDKIEISGGSLDVYIKNVITIQPSAIHASIAIPKERLFNLIKDLPNQPLKFEIIGLDTQAPTIKVSTLHGKYVIPISNGEYFPQMPIVDPTTFNISAENLLVGIDKTSFACSEDDLRPAMTGVLVNFKEDGVVYTATNANILSTVTLPTTEKIAIENSFIIPAKVLKLLQNLPFNEMITVDVTEKNIQFTASPELVVQSVLIAERYPDYEGVIPVAQDKIFDINRLELLSCIKRVSKFSNPVTAMVVFDLSCNSLGVSSKDTDMGSVANEDFAISYIDEPLEIGLSGRFLTAVLNRFKSDMISIALSTEKRAAVIKEVDANLVLNNKENLVLIMPMFLEPK